ncbi:hypothetical protein TBLA_0E02420 [Henningerozyma blattae CBS 6284]|uniref:Myosin motor domain-containing protein n=1 Tax=Henningerozyma blattae (strain ATCC 34711 / CBS 6284 / DSM 70876 / NBRC 10599 / NRRL Y-10934 / UCD 77-7) TaxID=1071380 RepID=I2H4J4_HENB6|nr:hypothetical protein TBLA_0E02420 [Tetrapisispora blattae CBS 6284]CCH61296.1 hypothetical protein TBLA_0E02420 [Tetrapisispora blattae CBS 6284]
MSYEVGTRCWLPDTEKGWIGCEITNIKNTNDTKAPYIIECTCEDGTIIPIESSTLDISTDILDDDEANKNLPLLRNPPILESTDDLTSLSYLNEPAVLNAIKQRYSQLNIYTYSGIVLIATNPFDRMDQLYSQDMIQAYAGKRRGEMEPHLFAIAEEAYSLMKNDKKNQTIVVSGESGAGKTVSAKYIMRYFASVEEEFYSQTDDHQRQVEMSETEEKILATNPIMESFGNAKTTRNDNSSRFGKYLEILFDDHTAIIGAKMRTYLLERSRLVYQPAIERNYHIFYQILKGLPQDMKDQLYLKDAKDYFYTNQGGDNEINGVDDAKEFKITTDALTLVGIDQETQNQLFKILASLLHIGNIELKKTKNDASLSSDEPNLKIACELLGIDPSNFAKWITKKQIITRSEKIVSNLNYSQAIVSRDSVAKFIYSGLFDWLVDNINTVLCNPDVEDKIATFIGVLDIYGFEHFDKNSFEQFCINYANEKLQQEFNQHVFKLEQEEYINEQIEWSFIEFNDNQPCIDLIENKLGILSLLDEESRLPAGSDESWTQKLYQTLDKPPTNKVFKKPRFGQTKFVVSHYAIDVAYDTEGFIEKNRDTVSDGHLEVLRASTNQTLLNILNTMDRKNNEDDTSKSKTDDFKGKKLVGRAAAKKPTLGSMFKKSLVELMTTINSTNVHYIRCIKPNNEKEPWKFDNLMVLSQLRACGVLETIRISCAGFPTRWTFNEFVLRYYFLLSSDKWIHIFQNQDTTETDIIDLCKKILHETVKDSQKYQIGNTKIFFKAGMLAYLEKLRSDKMHQSSVLIQKNIRAKHYRKKYLATITSIKLLQSAVNGVVVRKRVDHKLKTRAATTIQSLYRGFAARKQFNSIITSVIRIQSKVRQKLAQQEVHAKRQNIAAVNIQKRIRSFKPRSNFINMRRSTVVVQSLIRRKFAKQKLSKLKSEAKSLNHLQEVSYKLENKVVELTQNLASRVKENKDLTIRIKDLQKSLNDTTLLKEQLDNAKIQREEALLKQKDENDVELKEIEDKLALAKQEIENKKQEIEEIKIKHDELKQESIKQLAELNEARQQLADSRTENNDLQNEVLSLKEEITRLQASMTTATLSAAALAHTPSRGSNSNNGSNLFPMNSPRSPNKIETPQTPLNDSISKNVENNDIDDAMSTKSTLSEIDDEIYKMLQETATLNAEITNGLLKGYKVPHLGVATNITNKEILYPSRIIIIVLSDMWRLGLTQQSEVFLAEVLQTIQSIVFTLKGGDIIAGGAFWLTNVHELYSFVVFALQSIDNDDAYKNGLDQGEIKEYLNLVTELKDDFESLSYNVYNLWMKKLEKELQKMVIQAVILSEALPGFQEKSNSLLPKIFGSTPTYKMDNILNFLNNIYWSMKSFKIENEVFRQIIVTLLNFIDSTCFNDLIMRRNFLSWKRGIQLNYNITRLEEWCKAHHIADGADHLKHLIQTAKLLQLRKQTVDDILILREICNALTPMQLQKLMSLYSIADYEEPIPTDIMNYVADFVKNETAHSSTGKSKIHSDEILLHIPNGPFEDPFRKTGTREFGRIEAYIPSWLDLPLTQRIVSLVTKYVSIQDSSNNRA